MKKMTYNYLLVTASLAGLLSGCIATQQQKVAENIRALNAARSTQVLAGVEAQDVSVAINNPSNNETANATVLMGEMTLSQCVKLALTHSIELFKQELELDKASADVNRAFYSVFPKLNLSGDVNTLTPFDDPDKESYDLKLTLTQPLWQGGAISAAYRYANYEYEKELIDEINKRLDIDEQVILLLNRRGYSTTITCKECGETIKCPNCDIPLTYHKTANKLNCHYCNYTTYKPKKCNSCGSNQLHKIE